MIFSSPSLEEEYYTSHTVVLLSILRLLLLLLLRLDTLNHNASIFFLYIKSKVACLFPLCCLKETNTTAKIYNPLSTRVTLYDERHRERAEAERERERERERFVCDVVSRSSLNRSDELARFFSLRFDFVSRSHEGDTKRRRVLRVLGVER